MNDSAKMTAVGLLVIVAILFNVLYVYGTGGTVTATVNRAERIVSSSGDNVDSYYLLFTDRGVFRNSDSLLSGKFNSSDIQGMAADGQKLRIRYYGWRVPMLSWYPNVVTAELTN